MKRSATVVVLVAALAVLTAGCGSGGSKSGNKAYAGSVSAFAGAMNSICNSTNAQLKPLRPKSAADLAANGPKVKDLLTKALDKMESLTPPDQIKGQVSDFISKERDATAKLDDIVSAAKSDDLAKIRQVGTEIAPLTAAAHEDARKIGAPGCAQTGG
jgi:hypothetical protein